MGEIPWEEIVEFSGLILAFLALGFSIKQFIDAREHTSKLKDLSTEAEAQQVRMNKILETADAGAKRLEVLASSLPTRFVGTFPDVLDPLTTFIGTAKREVSILCDYAGYGYYSNPISFAAYFEEMRRRCVGQPKVEFKLLLYSRAAGEQAMPLQFDKDKFDEMSSSKEFKAFYSLFSKRYPSAPATFAEWDAQTWEIEEGYRQALRACGADLRVVSNPIPVFLWIRDREDVVISFQSSAEFNDFTFRTSDSRFVEFFQRQFDVALADSAPYRPLTQADPPLLSS